MAQLGNEYMTTAQVASKLGLSVGTVQNLVTDGRLDAVRTHGGHRRIFVSSFEKYKETHGFREVKRKSDRICILHNGLELDESLLQGLESTSLKLISHPLDLLGMEQDIDVLFIDACNLWLQTTPIGLVRGLQDKYTVYIYNSDKLPVNSGLLDSKVAHLIPRDINVEFIIGFLAGRTVKRSG